MAAEIEQIRTALATICADAPGYRRAIYTLSLPAGGPTGHDLVVEPELGRPLRLNANLRYAGVKLERYQRDHRPDLTGLRFESTEPGVWSATWSFDEPAAPPVDPPAEAPAPEPVDDPPPPPSAEPEPEPEPSASAPLDDVAHAVTAAIAPHAGIPAVDHNPDLDGSRPYIADAVAWMNHQTAACRAWGLGNETSYQARIGTQELILTLSGGRQVTLAMQIVGSWDPATKMFRWAWDHEGVPASIAQHATAVRSWAAGNDFVELLANPIAADFDRCWEFTALALWLGQAAGAYAAEADGPMVFMTLGEPVFTSGTGA